MARNFGIGISPIKRFNTDEFRANEKERINEELYGSSKVADLKDEAVIDPNEELRRKHGGNEPRRDDKGNVIPINPGF